MGENAARERAADHAGKGGSRHEEAKRARPARRRIPVGEIKDDAGIEARLEGAEQEPQRVERGRGLREHHQDAGDPPADGDAGDGALRADPGQEEVARDFKQEIAEKENPGAKAVCGLAELEVVEHLELGEADIDAVDPGDDPQQREERNQAPGDPGVSRLERRRRPFIHREGFDRHEPREVPPFQNVGRRASDRWRAPRVKPGPRRGPQRRPCIEGRFRV